MVANKNKMIIEEHVNEISSAEGEFNAPKIWKLKRKLFPKGDNCIRALKDPHGNLVTSKDGILRLYYNSYKDRLTKNTMKAYLKELEIMKENLQSIRERLAEHNKIIPWNRKNLHIVLQKLDGNKSKDPL